MIEKRTLEREVYLSGIGVHSGKNVRLILKPSTSGELIFRRIDIGKLELRLDPKKIEAKNNSSLVTEKGKIQTLEHLMATLFVFGIDSLEVELDADEFPIMDGSAAPFVQAILQAGTRALPQKKKHLKILKSFTLQEKDASFSSFPDSGFKLSYIIDYAHPVIGRQELSMMINARSFQNEIAPARTFGFIKDVDFLRSQGLALGASLENTVALDEEKVVNGPLRFPDEFVRHKLLDLTGDLALLGVPLLGHFRGEKAGHRLHLQAVNFLIDNPEFWTYQ